MVSGTEIANILRSRGKRDSTIEQYVRELSKIPPHLFDDIPALNDWIDRQGAPPSRRYMLASAIRCYYREVLHRKDLAVLVDQIKYTSAERPGYLEPNQIIQLRRVLTPTELLATDLMLAYALRRAIVVDNLSPSHFDFEKNILHIPKKMLGNKSNVAWTLDIQSEMITRVKQYCQDNAIFSSQPLFQVFYRGVEGRGRPSGHGGHNKYILAPIARDGYHRYANQLTAFTKLYTVDISIRVGFPVNPHLFKHTKGTHFQSLIKDINKTRDALMQKSLAATARYTNKGATVAENEKYLKEVGLGHENKTK